MDRTLGLDLDRLPSWPGECCAIIAGGASVKSVDLEALRERIHVAVVNNAWQLAPWAELLYACDLAWWQKHHVAARAFQGLKVTQDPLVPQWLPDEGVIRIEVTGAHDIKTGRLGFVGSGSNGAFQLLNLLVQIGCTGIALVGVDCIGEHWHERHPLPLTNPSESAFAIWRKSFDDAAPVLDRIGVDVVNCSPISTVRAFPKMPVHDALTRWGL